MQQLHDPTAERDACGIGFVADTAARPSREVLDAVLEGLRRVRHRGATAADRRTGDGAGVLLPLTGSLLPVAGAGLAMVFLRDEVARQAIEEACSLEAIEIADWRPVPVDPAALGPSAQASAPRIEQAILLRPPGTDEAEAERRAHRARRRAERTGDALELPAPSVATVRRS